MDESFEDGLREAAQDASRELMERIRAEYVRNVRQAQQGADGLEQYVTDVKQRRDTQGRFESGFYFEVNHGYAPLHEHGGPIEPTYGKMKAMGWTRDEIYTALTDCNEYVTRKHLLRDAINEVRADV